LHYIVSILLSLLIKVFSDISALTHYHDRSYAVSVAFISETVPCG